MTNRLEGFYSFVSDRIVFAMGISKTLSVLVVSALLTGCERGEPTSSSPAVSPHGATADAVDPSLTVASTAPSTQAADEGVRKFPEDLDVDPVRDPLVRARAKQLNALPVTGMKDLKVGDEVVILVRGDKGGGTIYGSGPYTIDSQLRKAVIHNGALRDKELGLVRIKVIKYDGEHTSVPQNDIKPTAYGKYHTSFTIEKIDLP